MGDLPKFTMSCDEPSDDDDDDEAMSRKSKNVHGGCENVSKEMLGGKEVVRMKYPGTSGVDVVVIPPSPMGTPPPADLLPKIKSKPLDLDLCKGEDAEFELVVEDPTDITVSWFRNKTLLLSVGKIKIWQESASFFMKIRGVDVKDEALYEIKVRNKCAEKVCDVQLLVSERKPKKKRWKKKDNVKEPGVIPALLTRLKHEYVIPEGNMLKLMVETEFNPTVSWYYEGRKLANCGSDFMKISSSNNIHMLLIEEVVPDDEGFYEFVAVYDDCEITSSTEVIVEENPCSDDDAMKNELNFDIDLQVDASSDHNCFNASSDNDSIDGSLSDRNNLIISASSDDNNLVGDVSSDQNELITDPSSVKSQINGKISGNNIDDSDVGSVINSTAKLVF